MFKILLALHLLFAIFAIGPLVHAATTASRGIRTGDAKATAGSARTLRIYSIASVVVVALGFGLMSVKVSSFPRAGGRPLPIAIPNDGLTHSSSYVYAVEPHTVADFSDTWIWLSVVLWVLSMALVLFVLVPTLQNATKAIEAEQSVVTMTARVAAAGGVVGILFAVIVFLMVYRPGS